MNSTKLLIQRFYSRNQCPKCPEPVKKRTKPYDIVEEKDCTPCSFYNWKPKLRKKIIHTECVENDYVIPRKCEAKLNDLNRVTTCEIKDQAIARWKKMDPHNKKACDKIIERPKPNYYCCKKELTVPKPDWDVNQTR